jgi:hypothetical protein
LILVRRIENVGLDHVCWLHTKISPDHRRVYCTRNRQASPEEGTVPSQMLTKFFKNRIAREMGRFYGGAEGTSLFVELSHHLESWLLGRLG